MKYLGNFSAVDPAYSRTMYCDECDVSWSGCWDNFQCPLCDKGELPSSDLETALLYLSTASQKPSDGPLRGNTITSIITDEHEPENQE